MHRAARELLKWYWRQMVMKGRASRFLKLPFVAMQLETNFAIEN